MESPRRSCLAPFLGAARPPQGHVVLSTAAAADLLEVPRGSRWDINKMMV